MIKATITPSISCAVVKLNEDASLSILQRHRRRWGGARKPCWRRLPVRSWRFRCENPGARRRHRCRTVDLIDFVEPLDLFTWVKPCRLAVQDILAPAQADRREGICSSGR